MERIRFIVDNFVDAASLSSKANSINIYINNEEFGDVTATQDGNTGFSFTTISEGSPTAAEKSLVETIADDSGSLGGTYFLFSTVEEDYYVWYNTGASSNPSIPDRVGVEVAISIDDAAETIALKTRIELADIVGIIVYEEATYPTLPVDNLKLTSRSSIMRTYSNDDFMIEGSFSGRKAVNSLVFGRHTFPVNTRYKIEFFDDSLFQNLIWSSGYQVIDRDQAGTDMVPWGDFIWSSSDQWGIDRIRDDPFKPPANLIIWLDEIVNNTASFRITLSKDVNIIGDYIYCNSADILCNFTNIDCNSEYPTYAPAVVTNYEASRLFIGNYIQPTFGVSVGHTLRWEEDTKQYRTESGTLRSDYSVPYRVFEFDLATLAESDRIRLQHEFRTVGLRKDFFMSAFPKDTSKDKQIDYSGIMKITKVPKFTEFAPKYYKSSYIMEEV